MICSVGQRETEGGLEKRLADLWRGKNITKRKRPTLVVGKKANGKSQIMPSYESEPKSISSVDSPQSRGSRSNEFSFPVSVTQSAIGALTGGGNTTETLRLAEDMNGNPNTYVLPSTYKAKGSVKSSGKNVSLTLLVSTICTNADLGDGVNRTLRGSLSYLITLNPAAGTMTGHKTGTFFLSGGGIVTLASHSIPEQPAPPPVNWYLSLTNLTTTAERVVTGSADIVFANERELHSLYETADFDTAVKALRGDAKLAVITRSEKGCVVVTRNGVEAVQAMPIERVVDVTGAGDLFAAGFMVGLARGRDHRTCARLGALAAAEVIQHMGARPAVSLKALAAENGLPL